MAHVEVADGEVRIHLSVVEEVLALHGALHIPLRHITAVSAEPVPQAFWRGVRMGANIPGVLVAGTFLTGEGAIFYDIRHGDRCLTLELAGETYRRVVVELGPEQDPAELAGEITAAQARNP